MGAYPQAVDINNDGLVDLVAGDSSGNVWFFRNVGTKQQAKLAKGVPLTADGKPIKGVPANYQKNDKGSYDFVPNPDAMMGVYSKLHVADWDADVLIGHDSPRAADEQLVWYRNVGSATEMKLAAPQKLELPLPHLPRPALYLVDWDGDGQRDVLVSTENSDVHFLRNTGTTAKPAWAEMQTLQLPGLPKNFAGSEPAHQRGRITVTDWNDDGKLDLVMGTFYYSNRPAAAADKRAAKTGGNVWLFLRK